MADLTGQQLGNYTLTQLLGQGGFADVYLGEHIFLKTPVAVKVLQGRMTPEDRENFIKEAQTIATLKHPHIVRVLDFGVEKNVPFLVMDYAANGTLRQRYPHGSRLSLSTILLYLKQVAAALQYAHVQKLVHRDVKPANMLIDANNNILLSDFGIVVTAHNTQSISTQEAMGTALYMAPEQARRMARPASDQYSLGIVVYEWLTGVCPFTGSTSVEIVLKHLSDPPPPFQKELKIALPVEQVIMKALAKDPGLRFASVQEFTTALEQATTEEKPQPTVASTNLLFAPTQYGQNIQSENRDFHLQVAPKDIKAAQGFQGGIVPTVRANTLTEFAYSGHKASIRAIAWSPDGTQIASGGSDEAVHIFDAFTGKTIDIIQVGETVFSLCW